MTVSPTPCHERCETDRQKDRQTWNRLHVAYFFRSETGEGWRERERGGGGGSWQAPTPLHTVLCSYIYMHKSLSYFTVCPSHNSQKPFLCELLLMNKNSNILGHDPLVPPPPSVRYRHIFSFLFSAKYSPQKGSESTLLSHVPCTIYLHLRRRITTRKTTYQGFNNSTYLFSFRLLKKEIRITV